MAVAVVGFLLFFVCVFLSVGALEYIIGLPMLSVCDFFLGGEGGMLCLLLTR